MKPDHPANSELQALREECRRLAALNESMEQRTRQLAKHREELKNALEQTHVLLLNERRRVQQLKKQGGGEKPPISSLEGIPSLSGQPENLAYQLREAQAKIAVLECNREELQALYQSETFRYVTKPIWKMLDAVKALLK